MSASVLWRPSAGNRKQRQGDPKLFKMESMTLRSDYREKKCRRTVLRFVEGVNSQATVANLLIRAAGLGDSGSVGTLAGISRFAISSTRRRRSGISELRAVRELVEPVLGAHFFPYEASVRQDSPDAK